MIYLPLKVVKKFKLSLFLNDLYSILFSQLRDFNGCFITLFHEYLLHFHLLSLYLILLFFLYSVFLRLNHLFTPVPLSYFFTLDPLDMLSATLVYMLGTVNDCGYRSCFEDFKGRSVNINVLTLTMHFRR